MKLPLGDQSLEVELPKSMKLLTYSKPDEAKSLSEDEIPKAFKEKILHPIGRNVLTSDINSSTTIVIVVDDISRPTPTPVLVAPLIDYLEEIGVTKDQITFIFGLGVHREMTQEEAEIKLGQEIAQQYHWENHDSEQNLEYLGKTNRGTPININKTYYDADFKICIGLIEPHLWAGYSGGQKGIVPGIAGVDTIYHHHQLVRHNIVDVGNLEDNPFRDDLEEMVDIIGLDLLINVILTPNKRIHDLVIGEVHTAFEQGVEISKNFSELFVSGKSDVIISSPHPLGIDFRQSSKAAFNTKNALRKGGYMIVVSDCPEGRGNVSAADDPPSRWLIRLLAKILPSKLLMWVIRKQGYGIEDAAGTFRMFKFIADYNYLFVSPNMSDKDREILFVADHFKTVDEALDYVASQQNGDTFSVYVFPQGGSTYPVVAT